MGKAAYKKKVQVSADGNTWYDLPCTSPSLDAAGDVIDDTDMETNDGWRSRLLGLHDWSVQADSNWKPAHNALNAVRNAWLNRTALQVRYLPDGVDGFQGPVVVESYNHSGDIGDKEVVAISLQANGALAAYDAP